jgi:hypothetical protein
MMLRRVIAPLAGLILWTGAALAQVCEQVPQAGGLPPEGPAYRTLQGVLATALGVQSPRLDDGRRGPVTERAMIELCRAVPFPEGTDAVAASLDLFRELADLQALLPEWRQVLWSPDLAQRLTAGEDPGLPLRLAGQSAMTAAALRPEAASPGCAPLTQAAGRGLDALAGADPRIARASDRAAEACRLYPSVPQDRALEQGLQRFAALEDGRPGALATLLSPAFAAWLAEDANDRLRRLVGTVPAVVRLLEDFATALPDPTPEPVASDLPPSCLPDPTAVRYWSFDAPEAALMTASQDVRPAFEALVELRDTDRQLVGDIEGALGGGLTACLRDRIAGIVTAPDSPARIYQLDARGVESLAFVAEFQDRQAVVEALIGRSAPRREQLLSGTEAALRRAVLGRLMEEVERAADIFAAAAEPLPPTLDLPAPGLPDPGPVVSPETVIVTEVTDFTLRASITNEAFVEALLRTGFEPASSREVLKGDVRRVLRPLAEAEADRIVAADMEMLEGLVQTRWFMTPPLVEALAALPDLSQRHDLPETARARLLGVAYPNEWLIQSAFSAEPTLDTGLRTHALQLSERIVPDPGALRVGGSFSKEGCGCVLRREDHALVYGFYPFWDAPVEPAPGEIEEGDVAPAPAQVDFELIERMAFYGPQWVESRDSGLLELRHAQQWLNLRRDFTTSAHRHRTRVDLAIRLTGWETWHDSQIDMVVDVTAQMMDRFARFDDLTVAEARRFLPTLFDAPRPDGLTLIVDGYDGIGQNASAERLTVIVDRIAQPLLARGQTINLAFDLRLAEARPDESLFADIRDLLEQRPGGQPVIDRILVFLERPTADAARNLLQRMDAGPFRTDVRTDILRRILPVLPPGGHRFVEARAGDTLRIGETDHGQFRDDLIYFQDSFGGMGFWPVPRVAEGDPHVAVSDIVFAEWDLWQFPEQLKNFELRFDAVCAFACPNRFYLSVAAMLVGLTMSALVLRSFYSGRADRLAFRFRLVWIGNLTLLVLLVLLTSCDRRAALPPVFLGALVIMLLTTLVFNTYQYARNGPKP